MGSSHGITRIIRLAYYEDPSYVPLLRRAYELWRELQVEAGEQLLHITGSIDAGPVGSEVPEGSLLSCRLHDLPHELLDAEEINRRFPGYQLPKGHVGVLQPDGGFLLPERCVVAHVAGAQALGAEVRAREAVTGWEPKGDGVVVRTERGSYEADRLVLSAGAWLGALAPSLAPLAVPERQVLAWLQPRRPDLFRPERFPVFNLMVAEGRCYGFPAHGIPGFKLGLFHHLHEQVDPDAVGRDPTAEDEQVLRVLADRYFPEGAGPTMALKVCLFTNSPDEHFLVDLHPEHPQVVVASPCSGHGFKFASVMGEILADFATEGRTRHDVSLFRLDRFASHPTEPLTPRH
jgi:sarcosine oxidase